MHYSLGFEDFRLATHLLNCYSFPQWFTNNAPAPIPNQSTLSFREGLQEFLLHMSGPRQPQTQNEIWVLSARGMTELFQPLWVNPISQSGKSSAMPRGGDYPHLCQLCPQPQFGPNIQSLEQ